MAGLYLHIPFCKTRCIYCAFHSGTDLSQRTRYVSALCSELRARSRYLGGESIATVYFGGGTPSLLEVADFEAIFDTINANFALKPDAEITLECNPDDVSAEQAAAWAQLPFNRVSVGVQSFDDDELRFLRRRHTAVQAENAVRTLQKAGFRNISIDLMFGLPTQTLATWTATLHRAIALGVQHISAYSLTYEGDTPLVRLLREQKIAEADEELCLALFKTAVGELERAGFEQYEISNFCQPRFQSRHNSAYWSGVPYLGVGAAAHSYNGNERRWNVSDTEKYMRGIESGAPDFGNEKLTCEDRYNEFVFTSLRTRKGIDLQKLDDRERTYCLRNAKKHINNGTLAIEEGFLRLTRDGIFVSDGITSDLFHTD